MEKSCYNADTYFVSQLQKTYPINMCMRKDLFEQSGVCSGVNRVQDCSQNDKYKLYGRNEAFWPNQAMIGFIGYLESNHKCAGYCEVLCTDKYYYSDRSKG